MRRVNKSFDFARSPEGVILSTVEGRSARGKTPNVLRQAQDDLRQGFGAETGRMPVQTDKQDAYATGQAQGISLLNKGQAQGISLLNKGQAQGMSLRLGQTRCMSLLNLGGF